MMGSKFALLLVSCLLLGNLWPVESGRIINKIKEKIKNIKGYFTGDCESDGDVPEPTSSDQQTTTQTSNLMSTSMSTTTSTEYPRIDIRGQFDEVEERRGDDDDNDGPIATSRQLIRVGDNCPQGYRLARDRTCRRNV